MALPCLTFLSKNGDFTLEIANHYRNWDGILEYSIDRENWIEWEDANDILNSSSGLLYLRGTGNSVITGVAPDEYGSWIITPDDSQNVVSVEGNIESLLDWEKVSNNIHPNMEAGCFHDMFHNCTCLITAPELPATTLTASCYSSMFSGCTSLTMIPQLPAKTLANFCYKDMFYNCTSLASVPQLPATTLADSCYIRMFGGCTSLIMTPKLPATTLARSCYADMFYNCTSLTTASDLPATILAENCYADMFMNCINLVSPPAIFATTLNENCCASMFQGCTSLVVAPELPAMILADTCYIGMFLGCTNLVSAPELPATTLANNCYDSMFRNCINLTTIPILPATILVTGCYVNMFYGCSNLKISTARNEIYKYSYRIPSSGQGTDATNALTNMFGATGGTFTGSPAINTKYYTDHTEKVESIINITGGVIPGFDPVSYIVGKAAGGGGGGGSIALLTRAEWDALTTEQKQAYGLVAIEDTTTGFNRGILVYGGDYVESVDLLQSGTAKNNANISCEHTGAYKLFVLAVNSEASSYSLDISASLNNNVLTEETSQYNEYHDSGDNRRNYRMNVYDINIAVGDNLQITLTAYNNHSSFVFGIISSGFWNIGKILTTPDDPTSGSNAHDGMVVYGTFNNDHGGTITADDYAATDIITTADPGSSYRSSYIFWFK